MSPGPERGALDRAASMSIGRRDAEVLPMPADTRERLSELYRERDEADALRHASGVDKARGTIWAIGLRRLEQGEEVYESFGVLAAAGIELPVSTRQMLDKLPADFQRICQIDADGVVRTASVKHRIRSGR